MKNRIKECRLAAGMTREELADAIEMPTEDIKGIEESKEDDSTLAWFERVAAAVHVNPAYLVGWSDDPSWSMYQSTPTDDQLDTMQKAIDWQSSTEEKLRKLYTGGVVIHLKDGTKLYDHERIGMLATIGDCISGDSTLVPIDNVAYVERIESDEAD